MPSNEWLWRSRVQQTPIDTGDRSAQCPEGSETLPALLNRFPESSELNVVLIFVNDRMGARLYRETEHSKKSLVWTALHHTQTHKALEEAYRIPWKILRNYIERLFFSLHLGSVRLLLNAVSYHRGAISPSEGMTAIILGTHETKHCTRRAWRMLKSMWESAPLANVT